MKPSVIQIFKCSLFRVVKFRERRVLSALLFLTSLLPWQQLVMLTETSVMSIALEMSRYWKSLLWVKVLEI